VLYVLLFANSLEISDLYLTKLCSSRRTPADGSLAVFALEGSLLSKDRTRHRHPNHARR
jgi:hypothetical protein